MSIIHLRVQDLTFRQRSILVDALQDYLYLRKDTISAAYSMDALYMANSISDYNFKTHNYQKMTDSSIRDVYDVFVWLTKNYSSLPVGFRNRFPEKSLVALRQDLFNSILP